MKEHRDENLHCQICGTAAALEKSHVFPAFITRRMARDGLPLAGVPLKPHAGRGGVKRYPGGLYDRFACSTCEATLFRDGDNYFSRFYDKLMASETKWQAMRITPLPSNKFRSHSANGSLVHRFAVQTLLRAHFATKAGMREFDLEDSLDPIKKYCLEGFATRPIQFQIATFITRDPISSVIMGPVRSEGDFPTARFWIPHLTFYVALTAAGLPPPLNALQMTADAVPVYHTRRFDFPEIAWLAEAMQNHGVQVGELFRRTSRSARLT